MEQFRFIGFPCSGPIKPQLTTISPVDLSSISDAELTSKIYLRCQKCLKIFVSGIRSTTACSAADHENPRYEPHCEECTIYHITQCPQCENLIERMEGCAQMTCCSRGTGGCLGVRCPNNHGSNSCVTYCGHTWPATFDMTIDKLKKITGHLDLLSSSSAAESSRQDSRVVRKRTDTHGIHPRRVKKIEDKSEFVFTRGKRGKMYWKEVVSER